jgi:hypothetical protein
MAQMQTNSAPRYEEADFGKERNVITKDARRIGQMVGIKVDLTTWTVIAIVVRLERPVFDELKIKRPIFRTANATLPVGLISKISDVVQLNAEFHVLGGIISS